MSMILLLGAIGAASAGSVVWLTGEPDPLLAPELRVIPIEDVIPDMDVDEDDVAALEHLASELEALRPLAMEFDGEVEIMRRLLGAIEDVDVLRGEEDRELLYEALAFQGFAIQRYFQDGLKTEIAAAPYRVEVLGRSEITPWVDAVALDPDRVPDAALISEEPELLAFDALRARVLVAPQSTITISGMPEDATLLVDGVVYEAARARVTSGYHRISVRWSDQIIYRTKARMAPGDEFELHLPATFGMIGNLAEMLATEPAALALSDAMLMSFQRLDDEVFLAVPSGEDVLLYRIEGRSAVLERGSSRSTAAPEEAPAGSESGLGARLAFGGGWLYDGDYYTANAAFGAPHETSTVNASVPVITGGALFERGLFAAGAGADLIIPVGEWHRLPSGDSEVRLRSHPYVAVGLPWIQVSGGYLFPWQPTVGARAYAPLVGDLELSAAFLHGFGGTIPGDDSGYVTSMDRAAWLAIGGHFGG